ncbi:2-dehydropantoate 2-reductase [Vibrio sp. TBV020]|uniref:2-dehydropantoate 2-reductase n=1 Tax=Vibrio sp. TBV020 TaxID=3137398 RepID=UPI0038CD800E
MNIVVLGPGAIGSLWASYLNNAGHSVSVWSRHPQSPISIQRDELPTTEFANQSEQAIQNADLLLVTLKAPQVKAALSELQPLINKETIIVLMHNGMGTAEIVSALFVDNPLVLATTTHGAYRKSPQNVLHTGLGNTELGGYNSAGKRCDFLADVFQHALPEVIWNPTILTALWNKLAINCAINPLTAIHQITNGELAQPEFQSQLSDVIQEVSLTIQAEGIHISEAQLTQSVKTVIEATAKNLSSMQQDIVHQRQSEIDFITGYLIKKAQSHNIATPMNLSLFNAVKNIEQGWN